MKARADGSWTADGMGNEIIPQAYGMIGGSGQEGATVEEQPALTASHGQPGNVGYRMSAFGQYEDDDTASTLKQRDHEVGVHRSLRIGRDSSDFVASAEIVDYGVRRLTPVECERLQAFPDGWTEPAGSDSARYKAMGNAVTVNTVRWILGRMLEQS